MNLAHDLHERLQSLELARMGAANGPLFVVAYRFAGLHVILALAHFFLFAAALDQLAKPPDGLLNRFAVSDRHVNHHLSCFVKLEYVARQELARALIIVAVVEAGLLATSVTSG